MSFFDGALIEIDLDTAQDLSGDLMSIIIANQERLEAVIKQTMNFNQIHTAGGYAEITLILKKKNLHTLTDDKEEVYIILPRRHFTLTNVNENVQGWIEYLSERLEDLLLRVEGSGFVFDSIKKFVIRLNQYNLPNNLGNYVKFPLGVRGANQIYNPNNPHVCCVYLCLVAAIMLRDNPHKHNFHATLRHVSKSFIENRINTTSLTPPFKWEDLGKLEILNKTCINVYMLDKNKNERYELIPARQGNSKFQDFTVNLLVLDKQHVCLIKNFTKFYNSFMRISQQTNYICHLCLLDCKSKEFLDAHFCSAPQQIVYPPEGSQITFRNYGRTMKPAVIGCFDFESVLIKNNDNGAVVSIHEPISYGYILLNREGVILDKFIYTGPDAATHFINRLLITYEKVKPVTYPLHMTSQQQRHFEAQTHCALCNKRFEDPSDKTRNHDHLKKFKNYVNCLCRRCNLQCKETRKLIMFAHNMSYDMGLLLKSMSQNTPIKILPKEALKMYKVDMGDVRFIDSLAFMNASLDSLSETHIKSGKSLKYTKAMLDYLDEEAQGLLLNGKQHFPYVWFDSASKLHEKCLPAKEHFYNDLKQTHITDADYAHCLEVWRKARCQTFKDYLEIYLRIDCGLLLDIFVEWRDGLYAEYGLDISNYMTLSSFGYDAFLRYTSISIDLISDPELIDLIEKNVRGGFTCVVKRYSRANNKYVNPNFNPLTDIPKYILYLDFNSLYATVMTKPLPYADIAKLSHQEMESFLAEMPLTERDIEGDFGYLIHCDTLPVSEEVALKTDELPLGLQKINIKFEDLSSYSKKLIKNMDAHVPKTTTKLVGSHAAKQNYLLILPLLQIFMQQGLEIGKIHTIYKFRQTAYLKEFINKNVRLRNESHSADKRKCLKRYQIVYLDVFY